MKSILALAALSLLVTPSFARATAANPPAATTPASATMPLLRGDDAYFYDEAGNNGPCHSHAFFFDPTDSQARATAKSQCDSMNYRRGCALYHMTMAYLSSRAC